MNNPADTSVPVRIVLFDLGGVLLDWDPARLYKKLIPDAAARQHFLDNICTMAWHTRHDAGVSFADNAADLIAIHPNYSDLIHAWRGRWMEMFDGYIDGVPALIDRLDAKNIPFYALSNMPKDPWPEMREYFSYLRRFRDVVVSAEENCVKPDPKIYQIALDRVGAPTAREILFIDDRQDNIDAAAQFGFQTHLFTTAECLEIALKKFELIG